MPKVHGTGDSWLITTQLGCIKIGPVEDEFKQRSVAVFINGEVKTEFLLSPYAAEGMRKVLDQIKFQWNYNDMQAKSIAVQNGIKVRMAIRKLLQICKQ